jgi:hypothetical protein
VKELHDIVRALTDYAEGFCRDVTFVGSTWEGVDALIEHLERLFNRESATDNEGQQVLGSVSGGAIKTGSVHLVLGDGSGVLRRLQVFVDQGEVDEHPRVELTFFPEDVVRAGNVRQNFIDWLDDARRHLQARRYYARYENASWTLGDTGPTSGVFLVSNEAEHDA